LISGNFDKGKTADEWGPPVNVCVGPRHILIGRAGRWRPTAVCPYKNPLRRPPLVRAVVLSERARRHCRLPVSMLPSCLCPFLSWRATASLPRPPRQVTGSSPAAPPSPPPSVVSPLHAVEYNHRPIWSSTVQLRMLCSPFPRPRCPHVVLLHVQTTKAHRGSRSRARRRPTELPRVSSNEDLVSRRSRPHLGL
jgi:hypothetical protein